MRQTSSMQTNILFLTLLATSGCSKPQPRHPVEYLLIARHNFDTQERRDGWQEFLSPASFEIPEFVVACAGEGRGTEATLRFVEAGKEISCLYSKFSEAESPAPSYRTRLIPLYPLWRQWGISLQEWFGIYDSEDHAIEEFPHLEMASCSEERKAGRSVEISRVSLSVIAPANALEPYRMPSRDAWKPPQVAACAFLRPTGAERPVLKTAGASKETDPLPPLPAIPLPLHPGRAGALTLLGVDSDGDGVRDDLNRYIAAVFPLSQKLRAAASWYVKAKTEWMTPPHHRSGDVDPSFFCYLEKRRQPCDGYKLLLAKVRIAQDTNFSEPNPGHSCESQFDSNLFERMENTEKRFSFERNSLDLRLVFPEFGKVSSSPDSDGPSCSRLPQDNMRD